MAKKKKKTNNKKKPPKTKIKPQENNQQSSGVNFPAQECKLTLDHLSVPADSTAQDHTEDHAKYLEDRKEQEGGFVEGKIRVIQAQDMGPGEW